MMAKIIYKYWLKKEGEDQSLRTMGILKQITYVKNIKACLELGIPMLSIYIRVISEKKDHVH